MLNLKNEVKQNGNLLAEINIRKKEPVLLAVALVHGDKITWITVAEDEKTDYPFLENPDLLTSFFTEKKGQEYAGGFIDSSRTFLPYKKLMGYEKNLHHYLGEYAKEFYSAYYRDYPEGPYDVRLHYFMIKGIRKHAHYSDDFVSPWVHPYTFYHGWTDPVPWYLLIKTFGTVNSWPSFARMRLLAENSCYEDIPLALKVLKDKKANDSIRHYALIVAGLDETNDEYIRTFDTTCSRALVRVWSARKPEEMYKILLDNALTLEQGATEDILDDAPVTYGSQYHHKYEDYRIAQRGFIFFSSLTDEQIEKLGEVYLRIAGKLTAPLPDEKRLYWGNALKSFFLALSTSYTQAGADFLWKIYYDHNTLLYGISSQDTKLAYLDAEWAQYLYDYVVKNGLEKDFLTRLTNYLEEYDPIYSDQRFFLTLYAKICYHQLPPGEFYAIFAPLLEEDYVNVEAIWMGVTNGYILPDDSPSLDHRWTYMFENFNYYAWNTEASQIYQLVRHRIEPHPEGLGIEDWYEEQEKWKRDEYDDEEYDERNTMKQMYTKNITNMVIKMK